MRPDLSRVSWKKASRSNANGGDCVEVGIADGHGAVRDTKNRAGGTLVLTSGAFAAFLQGAARGTFDR